jgi:hypothetical protein
LEPEIFCSGLPNPIHDDASHGGISMFGISRFSWHVARPLVPAVLATALLAGWIGWRGGGPETSAVPFDEWDIPRMVAHLNDAGLQLRIVSTLKNGLVGQAVFLTTTSKEWQDLNRLPKDQKQIHRWQGTLYCESSSIDSPARSRWSEWSRQWGDCCLVAGPFFFYGDPELLDRVRAALAALARSRDRITTHMT